MMLGSSGSPDKSGEASSGPLPARSLRRLSGDGPYYSLSPPLAIPKIGSGGAELSEELEELITSSSMDDPERKKDRDD